MIAHFFAYGFAELARVSAGQHSILCYKPPMQLLEGWLMIQQTEKLVASNQPL